MEPDRGSVASELVRGEVAKDDEIAGDVAPWKVGQAVMWHKLPLFFVRSVDNSSSR